MVANVHSIQKMETGRENEERELLVTVNYRSKFLQEDIHLCRDVSFVAGHRALGSDLHKTFFMLIFTVGVADVGDEPRHFKSHHV